MQGLSHFTALKKIQKTDLPSWVFEEIFPMFETALSFETELVVGVSGGVDSMTLACLLIFRWYDKGFPFQHLHIVHCNHQIREQSKQEAAYLSTFFAGIDVQIFERPPTIKTTEKALRDWRYQCFTLPFRKKSKEKCFLFLGHHLEDRIESTFLNCIRGASLKGFLNMQMLQAHPLLPNIQVGRPLLKITKPHLVAFCKQFNIISFEDETNADVMTSQRNFLRHEIIEKLVCMNHGKSRFLESMKQVYQEIETFSSHFVPIGMKKISVFPSRQAEYAYLIFSTDILKIWNTLGIATNLRSSQIVERTKRITQIQSGWKVIHGVYFFFYERQLYSIKAKKDFRKESLTEEHQIMELGLQTIAGISLEANEERFLGATLRFPQPGDTFKRKTRNRWCINQKIPIFRRNFIPLAVKEGKIVHMRKDVMEKG